MSTHVSDAEPSRLAPCPCGSGKRYKHCHGAFPQPWNDALERGYQTAILRHTAKEKRRLFQQGLGREIVSADLGDTRLVFIGNQYMRGDWKSFHDFLNSYLKTCLTKEWHERESAKAEAERHPLIYWFDEVTRQIELQKTGDGTVQTLAPTGAQSAWLGLAYNLYLLQHNVELHKRLVLRLQSRDQFNGARYETYVAATFILAGFKLELEDEADPNSTHCEFFATDPETGKIYWVEAKARQPKKVNLDVGNQLYQGLRKRAESERIVFIDLNVEDDQLHPEIADQLLDHVKSREPKLTIDGQAAPPAYVFVTNWPSHLSLSGTSGRRMIVPIGFKIDDFGFRIGFSSYKEAFKASQRHAAPFRIMEQFKNYHIPSTFDGEVPEFAFGIANRRWMIGSSYELDDPRESADLVYGNVDANKAQATLLFQTENGGLRSLVYDLSEAEMRAYHHHPETFFSAVQPQTPTINDPVEFFGFIYRTYSATPREQLLTFMQGATDYSALEDLGHEELVLEYCDRIVRARFPPHS